MGGTGFATTVVAAGGVVGRFACATGEIGSGLGTGKVAPEVVAEVAGAVAETTTAGGVNTTLFALVGCDVPGAVGSGTVFCGTA